MLNYYLFIFIYAKDFTLETSDLEGAGYGIFLKGDIPESVTAKDVVALYPGSLHDGILVDGVWLPPPGLDFRYTIQVRVIFNNNLFNLYFSLVYLVSFLMDLI